MSKRKLMPISEMKRRVLAYANISDNAMKSSSFDEIDDDNIILYFRDFTYHTSWKRLYDALMRLNVFAGMTPEQVSIWFDMNSLHLSELSRKDIA